jgi:hypothetical protein
MLKLVLSIIELEPVTRGFLSLSAASHTDVRVNIIMKSTKIGD